MTKEKKIIPNWLLAILGIIFLIVGTLIGRTNYDISVFGNGLAILGQVLILVAIITAIVNAFKKKKNNRNSNS